MSEDWDPKKVAAECAATARAKAGPRQPRVGEPPPITITSMPSKPTAGEEYRDELGWFKAGHPGVPGTGRPTKYKPEYVDQARRLAQIGATNLEMSDFFEVDTKTFRLWRNIYPEFGEAVKLGKEKPDDRVERSMYERAVGYDYEEEVPMRVGEEIRIIKVKKHVPPDPGAMAMWLSNRRPRDWQVKRTIEHSGTIEHVTVDEARKALEDYYRNGGGEIIDVTPTLLPAPESERVIIAEDDI